MNRRNLLSGAVLPLGFVLAARVEETLAYFHTLSAILGREARASELVAGRRE